MLLKFSTFHYRSFKNLTIQHLFLKIFVTLILFSQQSFPSPVTASYFPTEFTATPQLFSPSDTQLNLYHILRSTNCLYRRLVRNIPSKFTNHQLRFIEGSINSASKQTLLTLFNMLRPFPSSRRTHLS